MQILYFFGDDCPQCKALKPNFIAECDRLGINDYQFINAENESNDYLVRRYRLRSVPTLLFLEDGKEKGRAIGAGAWKQIRDYV